MRDYNKTTTSITIALNAQIEKNNENKQKEEEESYASHGSNSVYHHIKHKVCSLVFVCLLLFINHNDDDDDDLILVFGLFLFLSFSLFFSFIFFFVFVCPFWLLFLPDRANSFYERQDSLRSGYLSDRETVAVGGSSRSGGPGSALTGSSGNIVVQQQTSIESNDSRLCYLTSSEVGNNFNKQKQNPASIFESISFLGRFFNKFPICGGKFNYNPSPFFLNTAFELVCVFSC